MRGAINVFSMAFAYIHYCAKDVFPADPPRDYISSKSKKSKAIPITGREGP
jgi:hypothetical protein